MFKLHNNVEKNFLDRFGNIVTPDSTIIPTLNMVGGCDTAAEVKSHC